MGSHVRTVLRFAVFTRVLSLVLQALFNALIPDHAADAFSPPRAEGVGPLDPAVEILLGGLSRWDAEHFLFIAERGYLYEHNFAFLPLLPLSLRALADALLRPLAGWLSARGRLLLAAAGMNAALFVLSAVSLYRLGRAALGDRRLAFLSSLLFCLTPANVFLTSAYSEGLFAALTFAGLWLLETGAPLRACLALSLATAARANGLANAGFLVYLSLRGGLAQVRAGAGGGRLSLAGVALRFLLTASLGSALIALPFCVFQLYGYRTFCTPSPVPGQVTPDLLELAKVKGYRVPDATLPPPPWCSQRLPLLYSYIQDVYWDVGFLRYFQLKQAPNFLLALPVAGLVATAAWSYAAASPALCLRLGLWGGPRGGEKPESGFLSPRVFVYVVHAAVLLGFGSFCMHVQVLTRFLGSSSPVLYWFSAHLLQRYEPLLQRAEEQEEEEHEQEEEEQEEEQEEEEQEEEHEQEEEQEEEHEQGEEEQPLPGILWRVVPRNPVTLLLLHWRHCSALTRCLLGYFISYWLLGLALHCNFLPWT